MTETTSQPWLTPGVTKVQVVVTEDFLSRLITNPRRGLRELIDNALDADAQSIDISFGRTPLQAIDSLTVHDDGDGMSVSRAISAFGKVGDSWKRGERLTASGRKRRGRRGSGRWAAFSLGRDVTWTSVTHPVIGIDQTADPQRLEAVEVRGSHARLGEFDIEPTPVAQGASTGTVVAVTNVHGNAQIVDGSNLQVTADYATVLRRQPALSITIDGERLDPAVVIDDTHVITVDLTQHVEGGADGAVVLTVVDWAKPVKAATPTLVLTDAAGNGLYDHQDGVVRCSWNYTAYLAWDGFLEHRSDLAYPIAHEPVVGGVIQAGLDALRSHIKGRQDAARARLLENWKAERSYPYDSAADGPVEEAERDLFDLVAVTAAPAIENNDLGGRKLALRLLREAVAGNPSHLMTVLREVVGLDDTQLAELAGLLERTTLTSVITSASIVTHRLDILAGLEAVLHRREDATKIREPDHLHQIIAKEPWLLGDEYTTAVSERGLDEVLRSHQRLLGDERVVITGSEGDPSVLVEGKRGRLDLMLTRISPLGAGQRQNLVVELKRPGLTLDADQISQLEKYAYTIREDSRFHGQMVKWDFVLIGTKMSPFAGDKADQLDRSSQPNFRLRVMTWDQLIHQRRHQMLFVQRALEVSTTADTGVARLRAAHAEHLPVDL